MEPECKRRQSGSSARAPNHLLQRSAMGQALHRHRSHEAEQNMALPKGALVRKRMMAAKQMSARAEESWWGCGILGLHASLC